MVLLFIILTPKIIGEKKETTPTRTSPVMVMPTGLSDPVDSYARIIQKRILENLVYPASAKQAGFQGTTRISIRLTYTGKLLDVRVKDSSGYKILDDSSVYAAKSISSYPPFPPQIVQAELWINVPVTYQLN